MKISQCYSTGSNDRDSCIDEIYNMKAFTTAKNGDVQFADILIYEQFRGFNFSK